MRQSLSILAGLLLTTFYSFAQANKASTLIEEGVTLYDQGKYLEAVDKYKESYKLDSNNITLFAEMAMTYLALKDYTNTELICKKAISKFGQAKGLENIYTTYANSLDNRQQTDESLKIYKEGLAKFPNYFGLYFNKGVTEYNLKRNYEARTSFQNAIKLNPKHPSSYYYLGIIENNFENRVPAILALSRFLILEPKGQRAAKILPFLTKKVNNLYYNKKEGKTISTYSSAKPRTDTTMDSFKKVEETLLMVEVASNLDVKVKDDLEKFETTTQEIFELLKAHKKDNSGFYWDFLAPYFIELESNNHVKAFNYYINIFLSENSEVQSWVKKNENEVDKFLDWSKNYKW